MLNKTFSIPHEYNQVGKSTLIVTGSYAEVQIDVLLEEDAIEDDRNLPGRGGD